jgi:hypothetical protein
MYAEMKRTNKREAVNAEIVNPLKLSSIVSKYTRFIKQVLVIKMDAAEGGS